MGNPEVVGVIPIKLTKGDKDVSRPEATSLSRDKEIEDEGFELGSTSVLPDWFRWHGRLQPGLFTV